MSESEGAAGLWEYVVQLGLEKYETGETQPRYSTVVIVGASRSGKSSLVHMFLDKSDEPKPSLPVEYTYVRRTNKNMVKDVCYIWEIELSNAYFIRDYSESENLDQVSVLIVVDLHNPHDLRRTCEAMEEFNLKAKESGMRAVIRYGIIGTKYDAFEEYSMEKKAVICRLLKHYATVLESALIFCTKHDKITIKVSRDLFTHLAFNTKFSHQLRFDLDSPIVIPKGEENRTDTKYLHQTFETQFGQWQPTVVQEDFVDPGEDPNYANEVIDKLWKGIAAKKLSTLD